MKSPFRAIIASLFLAISSFCQIPPYFTPGTVFIDGQRLTAAELEALVANATLNYPFYSTATAETSLGNGDLFLVLNSGNQFRKITAANALLDNTNWYSGAAQETNVTTNAFVLVWDGGATGQIFKVGLTNWPSLTAILTPQTNWDQNAALAAFDPLTGQSWSESWSYIGTNWVNWFSFTNSPGVGTNGNITNFPTVADADLVPWYDSAAASNGVTSFKTIKYSVTNSAIAGGRKNLIISSGGYSGVDPGYLTITADEIVLKNITNTGASYICTKLASTLNQTAFNFLPPWGGVDTNTSESLLSTWYYVWVISDGTNNGCVLSTNPVAPLYPTNVTYSALVGAARTMPSAAAFDDFLQLDKTCYIVPTNLLFGLIPTNYSPMWATNQWQTNSGVATNLEARFNMMVPPIAKTVTGYAGSVDTTSDATLVLSSGSANVASGFSGVTNAPGEVLIHGARSTLFQGYTFSEPFTIPVQTTSSNAVLIWWRCPIIGNTNGVTITGYGL